MHRQFIDRLQARESVDEIYRVADKQLRANRQGNEYLLLQLADRSGQISGMRWNASQSLYESFQKGDFLRIVGLAQLHNGMLQIIVQDLENVPRDKVDMSHFATNNPQEIDDLLGELKRLLGSVRNEHLRRLVEIFVADERLMERLKRAPAGIKTHHAYEGGLLKHIVELMRLAQSVAPSYPQLDCDMLLTGVFLHDIGKLEELSFDGDLTYTDPGQMLGHLVQGVVELERRAKQVLQSTGQAIPEEMLWRLEHMIVSHHGQLEHGSPKVPMTLEALVLHYLDDMDAKLNTATELIRSDRNSDSRWTAFHPILGRKMFKPSDAQKSCGK